jgi:ubiquitin-activating enzyme E1
MLETCDLRFFGRSDQIHVGVRALYAFYDNQGRYPNGSEAEVAQVLELANKIKDADVELDEPVIKNLARFAEASITSTCAFFGGIVAQEVVKFTGKYKPLKQWLHYDTFESVPDGEVNRTPMGCRYDDQIRVYGREVQEKLGKVNTFMVGAGALGCEYIKAMALMGLGCG